jgi:hypothetical protein
MIEEAFGYRLSQDILREVLPNYQDLNQKLISFAGTNCKRSNHFLNQIMNEKEKICLEKAFFGNNGWYKRINGNGMISLKLAAMSLGVTNNIFTFNKETETRILDYISAKNIDDQLLMMRCYIKQKAVTYAAMRNYLQKQESTKMTVTLYRGINVPYKNQKYLFTGLESWTTDIAIAYKFARNEGFVLKKEYPIDQILAGRRSTFKNQSNHLYLHNGFFVRREKEMIVENFEKEWDCSSETDVRLAIEKEVY